MIFIASDHAAFEEKKEILKFLENQGLEFEDLGTHSQESCNYSDYAIKLSKAVKAKEGSVGILMCASGIGVSLAANRFSGIRAARCLSENDSEMSRKHNNANVICLAARISSLEMMTSMVSKFLNTGFEGGRHGQRVNTFNDLGEK